MHPRRKTVSGFTLVEMLVVLGIVVFLAGLSTSAATALAARAQVRETEDTIELLDLAVTAWERAADRRLTWGEDRSHHDIWSVRAKAAPVLVITEVLGVIGRQPDVQETLARIDPDFVHRYDSSEQPLWMSHDYVARLYLRALQAEYPDAITVLDAWGTPIYATHPGALDSTKDADRDGTERTWNETNFGVVARNRQICFVSAGPDRRFGVLREFEHLPGVQKHKAIEEARRDNIFSYAPDGL